MRSAARTAISTYTGIRGDEANLRCLNPPGNEPDYNAFARLIDDRTGPSHKVIPKHSNMPHRFEEMEYALPAEAGLDCSGAAAPHQIEMAPQRGLAAAIPIHQGGRHMAQ